MGIHSLLSSVASSAASARSAVGSLGDDFATSIGRRAQKIGLEDGAYDDATMDVVRRALNENMDAATFRSEFNTQYRQSNPTLTGGTTTAASGDISDDAFNRIEAVRQEAMRTRDAGKYQTGSSLDAMLNNSVDSPGNLYAGYNAAGQTKQNSVLTKAFADEDGGGFTAQGALAAGGLGGLLGMGAAGMTGNDMGEGAAYGALIGMGGRGLGMMAKNAMQGTENALMKKVLGDDMVTNASEKLVLNNGANINARGMNTVGDVMESGYGRITLDDMNIGNSSVADTTNQGNFYNYGNTNRTLNEVLNDDQVADEAKTALRGFNTNRIKVNENEVRSMNLDAVRSRSPQQLEASGVGSKQAQEMLTNNKKASVGANMRILTMSGAMLGGVGFASKKKDHRRGFNRNRGNRI